MLSPSRGHSPHDRDGLYSGASCRTSRLADDVQRTAVRELVRAAPVIARGRRGLQRRPVSRSRWSGDPFAMRCSVGLAPTSTSPPRPPGRHRAAADRVGRCPLGRRSCLRHDRRPGRRVAAGDHDVPRPTLRRRDSRKPDVVFGDTLEGTCRRRDFAVNAMALALPDRSSSIPSAGSTTSPTGAAHTGPRPSLVRRRPAADDACGSVRRAARFHGAADVLAAMTAMAQRLEIISAERIRDELAKLVLSPRPRVGSGAARADRDRRAGAAGAARAAAGARRASSPQGRLRAHA